MTEAYYPWDGPTLLQLQTKLGELLRLGRAQSDGGWADITDQQLDAYVEFILMVLDAVSERDPDGDRTLSVTVLDRRKGYNPTNWMVIPHRVENTNDLKAYVEAISTYAAAINTLASTAQAFSRTTFHQGDGCKAKQYSDAMVCKECSLAWDVNDPDPPPCQ